MRYRLIICGFVQYGNEFCAKVIRLFLLPQQQKGNFFYEFNYYTKH